MIRVTVGTTLIILGCINYARAQTPLFYNSGNEWTFYWKHIEECARECVRKDDPARDYYFRNITICRVALAARDSGGSKTVKSISLNNIFCGESS